MATEASKTNALRSSAFFKTYLSGRVIDIGAGDDPVYPMQKYLINIKVTLITF